jgi:hypothetical protein
VVTSRRDGILEWCLDMVIVYYSKEELLDYGPNGRTSG